MVEASTGVAGGQKLQNKSMTRYKQAQMLLNVPQGSRMRQGPQYNILLGTVPLRSPRGLTALVKRLHSRSPQAKR